MDGLQLENQLHLFRDIFDRHFWRSKIYEGSSALRNKTRPVSLEFHVGSFQVSRFYIGNGRFCCIIPLDEIVLD